MARVAFVFAPYHHKRFAENLFVVDEDFGVFPPLNLAYAAAIAEKAGHEVMLIDANALRLTLAETIEKLRQFLPKYVGFYFSTYMFHDTLRWAAGIREKLDVTILAGGINLSLYPEESLSHRVIDYGVVGEALHALPDLLEALEGNRSPRNIPGVCWREHDAVVFEPPRDGDLDFNDFPFPARHLLPNDRYYSITSQRRNFTIIMTAKGCPYSCSYCAIAKIPYRARSVDNVLREIEECARRYNVHEIDFFDADFPLNRKRVVALCEGILELGLDLEWSCRSRVDSVDDGLLRLMHKAGCRKIYFGIETPSETHLRTMKKNITTHRVIKTLAATRAAGIRALGFFMTGVPGETHQSLLRTIFYAISLDLDYAQFSRTIAKPCTDLDSELIERTGKDFWRDYVLGRVEEARMPSPWTEMNGQSVEVWTKIAYYAYYYRPTYIWKALRRMQSFDEFKRSTKTALRMLAKALQSDH